MHFCQKRQKEKGKKNEVNKDGSTARGFGPGGCILCECVASMQMSERGGPLFASKAGSGWRHFIGEMARISIFMANVLTNNALRRPTACPWRLFSSLGHGILSTKEQLT